MGAIYKILQYNNPTPPTKTPAEKEESKQTTPVEEEETPQTTSMEKVNTNDLDPNEVGRMLEPYTNREIKRDQTILNQLPPYTFRPVHRPRYRRVYTREPLNGPREQSRGKF